MKYSWVFCLIILTACSKTFNNSQPANFDKTKLESLAQTYCASGEKLTELDLTPLYLDFEDLSAPVYGIMNGTGRCALTGDIHDAWGIGWFDVTINSSCVPNGSFWKTRKSELLSPTKYYTFESIDHPEDPLLEMSGARDLNSTYARDHAGLRPLKCISNSAQ
ncbi:MAG: hypothetical protein JSU04_16535 [Bdellovibrionales bacterium]|nr:hypothetical protein [Bdellovibrionales bacterium]